MPHGKQQVVLFALILPFFAVVASTPVATREAVEAIYHQQYCRAAELLEQSPDTLEAGFWQACLLQLLIYDSGNSTLVDSFYQLSDRVARYCLTAIRMSPADVEPSLYLGLVELNRANMLSWQQQKLAGMRAMLRAARYFDRAGRILPGDVRVLFGRGTIEYFRACANRYVLGLRLFGSRDRAYRMLQEVECSDALLQPAAAFMLGFMYKEDRQFDSSFACCNRLLQRYPGNRAARRLLRDALLAAGQPESALTVARGIGEELERFWPENRYGLTENWLKMSKAYFQLQQYDSVVYYADRVISWEWLQDEVPWLRNYVREARQLKRRTAR